MHIAFVVVKHFQSGGGIESYTHEAATRLASNGHRVEVYSMRHHGPEITDCEGVRIVTVPCLHGFATEKLTAAAMAALACVSRRAKPDIVHFHSVAAGAFAWLPKARRIPCVLQMHGIEWQRGRWNRFARVVLKFLEQVSIRQADAVTAVSHVLCDVYARKYGVNPVCIPGGANLKEPAGPKEILRLGLQPREYILFASRLVREKGAHYLIQAFRRLNPDCHLVIAGDAKGENAYRNELRTLAAGDPRILFPGFVQGRLLDELFSHALVFVQPSELEGLGLALLEAMSYGNICVASDTPVLVETLGGTGVLFASRDVDDLAAKMHGVLHSPDKRRSLGDQARRRVAQHFSWEPITDQLESLYKQVLKQH